MSPLSNTLKLVFLSIANIPIKKCCRIKHEHCTCDQPSSKGVRIKTYFGFDVDIPRMQQRSVEIGDLSVYPMWL